MKLIIDTGHGGRDKGATKNVGGQMVYESNLAYELGRDIKLKHPNKIALVPHDPPRVQPDPNRLVNRVMWAVAEGCDYFLSIHFNSSNSKTASGIETWYASGIAPSRHWADTLSAQVAHAMGLRDRTAKPDDVNRHHRLGILHGHLHDTRACLLEVCFLSNLTDLQAFNDHRSAVIEAVLESVGL